MGNTVMARLQASGEAHTLSIEAIIAKVNTEIKNQLLLQLLGDEVSGLFQGKEASGDLLQALLQKLLPTMENQQPTQPNSFQLSTKSGCFWSSFIFERTN